MDSVLPAAVLMFHSLNSEEKRVKQKNCASLDGREVYIIHALRKVLRSAEFCSTSTFVSLCVSLRLKKRRFNHGEWLPSVVKTFSLFLCLSVLNFYAYLPFVFCFRVQSSSPENESPVIISYCSDFGWSGRTTFSIDGHSKVAVHWSVITAGKISYEKWLKYCLFFFT